MHVANLQLEGLLMAVAAINKLMVSKGLLTVEEIDQVLHKAEACLTGEERMTEDLSPSNRDAACFPIRLLRRANSEAAESGGPAFSDLARGIGLTKRAYNDQL
jgi:hypothetical protein